MIAAAIVWFVVGALVAARCVDWRVSWFVSWLPLPAEPEDWNTNRVVATALRAATAAALWPVVLWCDYTGSRAFRPYRRRASDSPRPDRDRS